jgi:hypothetical protein
MERGAAQHVRGGKPFAGAEHNRGITAGVGSGQCLAKRLLSLLNVSGQQCGGAECDVDIGARQVIMQGVIQSEALVEERGRLREVRAVESKRAQVEQGRGEATWRSRVALERQAGREQIVR